MSIQIGRNDVLWNYAATFLKIATSALLLPFILRMMPSEMVGIWSVFATITVFSNLLDFGFNPSFTRNVTYVFSGVKNLMINGHETVNEEKNTIDFGLLKGVVTAMRWFYSRMAIVLFILLSTLGTFYIFTLLKNYNGSHREVYIAWALLCIINTYNLYTRYYDSLLLGKGLVKRSKQIMIIGHTVYLVIGAILIMKGQGLVAIVSAQISSVIIIRWLSYRSFFNTDIKSKLNSVFPRSQKEVLKAIYPNALKIGLTILGGFMVLKSAIIIGALYLPLEDIASYGITMQLIAVINGLGGIYISTYQPKIAQLRILDNKLAIKELYLRGQVVLILTYVIGGIGLLVLGEWALNFINSQTHLIPQLLIILALVVSFLEMNHSIAVMILLSKNEVPFFRSALFAGGITIILLLILFQFTNPGLWVMIASPGLVQGGYNNWKWPVVVCKELEITKKDVNKAVGRMIKDGIKWMV